MLINSQMENGEFPQQVTINNYKYAVVDMNVLNREGKRHVLDVYLRSEMQFK